MSKTSFEISTPSSISLQAICLFLLTSSFYLLEYMVQVIPGALHQNIMITFKMDALGLGNLVASFFYAYAPMQIIGGLLYDRFGPRRVLTLAIIIFASGLLLFSYTENTFVAELSFFLMGMGAATSFVGTLIIIAQWFPPHHFAIMAGILQFMGSIGAMMGETPIMMLTKYLGWHNTLLCLAILAFGLAILVALNVKDNSPFLAKKSQPAGSYKNEWHNLLKVCRQPQTWSIAFYSFCIWAPIVTFAAVWGVPYLQTVFPAHPTYSATAVSLVWLGVGVGSVLLGWLSDRDLKRVMWLKRAALLGVVSVILLLYCTPPNFYLFSILCFLIGIAGGGQSLSFALVRENNPDNQVGTASGFNNMMLLFSGAAFPPLIGYSLCWRWDGAVEGSLPIYALSNYTFALTLLPIIFVSAWIVTYFLKDKKI